MIWHCNQPASLTSHSINTSEAPANCHLCLGGWRKTTAENYQTATWSLLVGGGGGRLKAPECAYLSPVKKSVKGFEIQLLGRLVAAEAWQLPNLQLSTKIAVFLFQIWVFPAGILEDKEPLSGHFDGSVLSVLGRNLFLLFVFRLCSTWTAVVCKEKKIFWSDSCKPKVPL